MFRVVRSLCLVSEALWHARYATYIYTCRASMKLPLCGVRVGLCTVAWSIAYHIPQQISYHHTLSGLVVHAVRREVVRTRMLSMWIQYQLVMSSQLPLSSFTRETPGVAARRGDSRSLSVPEPQAIAAFATVARATRRVIVGLLL